MNKKRRLLRAFKHPRLFFRGMNRAYHRRGGIRSENLDGIHVFEEDWDTLVILDACRHDMFEEINTISGKYSTKVSRASSTVEWLQANVDGRDLSDTVYVTANPQLERNREKLDVCFHDVLNVWLDNGWDNDTGTVLADTMTEAAIRSFEKYPHKRLVIHYMQPHYPFVPAETEFDKKHLSSIESGGDNASSENVWSQKFIGELDRSRADLWDIYTDNLKYVLEHVESLLENIPGKSVITSDHGNYVGERASPIPIREYGHPRGIYDDVVVKVPWLVCENGDRRNILKDTTREATSSIDSEIVSNRLEDLGYK